MTAIHFDRADLMNTDGISSAVSIDPRRAGVWQRFTAVLIDCIVVLLPFQILAAILFALTAGTVQMYSGFTSTSCEEAKTVPPLLNPPPPRDSNFAQVCRIKLFGATTGILLTVGRTTKEGSVTKTVNQSYMVNEDGDPVDGIAIDWIAILAILLYLVVMLWKTGKTIGDRMVGIAVINAAAPNAPGIPLRKAILRYLAMGIGCVPALALLVHQMVTTDGSVDALLGGNFFQLIMYAALIAAVWYIFLIFQIARRRDPVYDRLAGTMVVRDTLKARPAGQST